MRLRHSRGGLLLLWLVAVVPGGSAKAGVELQPERPSLGHDATLVLDQAPTDSTRIPTGIGVSIWTTPDPRRFRVRPLRVGRVGVVLPAASDTLWWEVPRAIQEPDPSTLRGLHRVGDIEPSWWRQILGAALLLLALVLLLRRWLRRNAAPFEAPLPVVDPPHLTAQRRLRALRDRPWLGEGRFDEWYVEGSHILREYISGRYRVAALDWTSVELAQRLLDAGHASEEIARLRPLLEEADRVKFAAQRPTENQARVWVDDIEAFVESTAVDVVYSLPEALEAARRLNAGRLR